MVGLVSRGARVARAVATGTAVVLAIEIVIIADQAARGVPSHFNNRTALDAALFKVMGISIMLAWLGALVLTLVLVRERLPNRVHAAGLHWGLIVALVGMLIGPLMIDPMNEVVQDFAHSAPTELDGAHTVGRRTGGRAGHGDASAAVPPSRQPCARLGAERTTVHPR